MSNQLACGTMQMNWPTRLARRSFASGVKEPRMRSALFLLAGILICSANVHAQDKKPAINRNLDVYFENEVWPKVGAAVCLQCHKKGGDAEESKLILLDPKKLQGHAQE